MIIRTTLSAVTAWHECSVWNCPSRLDVISLSTHTHLHTHTDTHQRCPSRLSLLPDTKVANACGTIDHPDSKFCVKPMKRSLLFFLRFERFFQMWFYEIIQRRQTHKCTQNCLTRIVYPVEICAIKTLNNARNMAINRSFKTQRGITKPKKYSVKSNLFIKDI